MASESKMPDDLVAPGEERDSRTAAVLPATNMKKLRDLRILCVGVRNGNVDAAKSLVITGALFLDVAPSASAAVVTPTDVETMLSFLTHAHVGKPAHHSVTQFLRSLNSEATVKALDDLPNSPLHESYDIIICDTVLQEPQAVLALSRRCFAERTVLLLQGSIGTTSFCYQQLPQTAGDRYDAVQDAVKQESEDWPVLRVPLSSLLDPSARFTWNKPSAEAASDGWLMVHAALVAAHATDGGGAAVTYDGLAAALADLVPRYQNLSTGHVPDETTLREAVASMQSTRPYLPAVALGAGTLVQRILTTVATRSGYCGLVSFCDSRFLSVETLSFTAVVPGAADAASCPAAPGGAGAGAGAGPAKPSAPSTFTSAVGALDFDAGLASWLSYRTRPLALADSAHWKIPSYMRRDTHTRPGIDVEAMASAMASMTVLLIGAGGNGNELAVMLLACGVKNIVVVDFDFISPSNFNRQFLFAAHPKRTTGDSSRVLGMPKAYAACDVLRSWFPDATILAENSKFEDAVMRHGPFFDVIVSAVDNHKARLQIMGVAMAAGVPVVNCAAEGWRASACRHVPDVDPCFACRYTKNPAEAEETPPAAVKEACSPHALLTKYTQCMRWAANRLNELIGKSDSWYFPLDVTWMEAVDLTCGSGALGIIPDGDRPSVWVAPIDEVVKEVAAAADAAGWTTATWESDVEAALTAMADLGESRQRNAHEPAVRHCMRLLVGLLRASMEHPAMAESLRKAADDDVAEVFSKDCVQHLQFITAMTNLRALFFPAIAVGAQGSALSVRTLLGGMVPIVHASNQIAAAMASSITLHLLRGDGRAFGSLANQVTSTGRQLVRPFMHPTMHLDWVPDCQDCGHDTARCHVVCDTTTTSYNAIAELLEADAGVKRNKYSYIGDMEGQWEPGDGDRPLAALRRSINGAPPTELGARDTVIAIAAPSATERVVPVCPQRYIAVRHRSGVERPKLVHPFGQRPPKPDSDSESDFDSDVEEHFAEDDVAK